MLYETIEITMDYKALGIQHVEAPATMTTYIKERYPNDQNEFMRPLILICPGGGYGHHSPREGEAIALKMLSYGYNAVVLRYSLSPNEFPCQVIEAAYAMNYIREHAAEWDVDADKIVIAGFSAGGHVAASLSMMWNQKELEPFVNCILKKDASAIRPDGLLLGYPVITSGEFAHRGSFEKLIASNYDELLESVSLETRVTADMPPVFLWHTVTDNSVPVENSLLFASALKKQNVPFEMHIFPNGNHGLGLGTKETDTKDGKHYQSEVAVWTDLFETWMEHTMKYSLR